MSLSKSTESDEKKTTTIGKLSEHNLNAGDFPDSNSNRKSDVAKNFLSPIQKNKEIETVPNILSTADLNKDNIFSKQNS
jgi:hypothetical protein